MGSVTTSIAMIALGFILLLLVLVVAVQCILLSQMDKGHSTRVVQERLKQRTAQAKDVSRDQRHRAEDRMRTTAETCTCRRHGDD